MNEYVIVGGELYHYGVKGMKWGVRKARPKTDLDNKKAAYKTAKKEYNKSFNKAYNRAAAAYSPFKKHRQANDARWEDAANKAESLNKAKNDYKSAKADARSKAKAEKALAKMEKQKYKDAINKRSKEILAGESAVGKIWDVLTDSHKTQAKIEYDIEKRAKVNKAGHD